MNERRLQPQAQKKGWWGRNWKWVVPVGCLGLLVLFVAFAAAIVFLVFGIMKSSDAYKDAVAQAKTHQVVQEHLGEPLEEGLFVTGNINVSGSSGQASLAIPISGPKGKGTLYVEATKSVGQWRFATLMVEVRETGERIDVLETEELNRQMESEP
jgi:cytochrome oxidase complex assembly protein 1